MPRRSSSKAVAGGAVGEFGTWGKLPLERYALGSGGLRRAVALLFRPDQEAYLHHAAFDEVRERGGAERASVPASVTPWRSAGRATRSTSP
ncbi:hypothetical protein GCM10009730_07360 [Streptomyces albidochromogenes]